MVVVLKIDEQLLLFVNIGLWIDGLDLAKMFVQKVVLGNVLNAHFKLQECADFVSIEQKFNYRITALERVQQERVGLGKR